MRLQKKCSTFCSTFCNFVQHFVQHDKTQLMCNVLFLCCLRVFSCFVCFRLYVPIRRTRKNLNYLTIGSWDFFVCYLPCLFIITQSAMSPFEPHSRSCRSMNGEKVKDAMSFNGNIFAFHSSTASRSGSTITSRL